MPVGTLSNSGRTMPSSETCKWNAASNSIVFKFQRRDFTVTSIVDDGSGFAKVTISGTVPSGYSVKVDDYICLIGDVGLSPPTDVTGVYQVTNVTSANVFTIDLPYTFDVSGTMYLNFNSGVYQTGYTRKYINYYLEVKVNFTPPNGTQSQVGIKRVHAQPDGTIVVNLQSMLEGCVTADFEPDYNATGFEQNDTMWGSYNISYQEFYEGSSGGGASLTGYYITNSAKQIQETYGQNMGVYFSSLNSLQICKWLEPYNPNTQYHYQMRLRMWKGLPFELSIIWSELLTSAGIMLMTNYYADNDQFQTYNRTGPYTYAIGVNHLKVIDDSWCDSGYNMIGFVLQKRTGTIRSPIYTTISEEQLVYIECCIPRNPLYLRWSNQLGNYNYWCFSYNQEYSKQTGNAVLMERYVEELATASSKKKKVSQQAIQKVKFGASDLNDDDIQLVESIIDSVKVEMLMNITDWSSGALWQEVVVETGNYGGHDTNASYHGFEAIMELPQLNLLKQ